MWISRFTPPFTELMFDVALSKSNLGTVGRNATLFVASCLYDGPMCLL